MSEQNTNDLLHLFDKHLKAGDNFLPLKAFLQYIEKPEGDLNGFHALSTAKIPNLPRNPEPDKSQNIASTTKLIQKNPETDDPILAHILYKVIITVDYSPQSSSLDFIEKSLNVIFDKISHEFDQFYSNCVNTEPQIYVTVLLWNSSPNSSSQNQHPFLTIIHSKRLLKTNLSQMAAFIFNKVIEKKSVILESFKNTRTELRINTSIDEEIYPKPKTKSPFEEFLRILTKIFNFFEINPITATSLVLAHHVHITDGFIYANDMVRCLEKISKSAISFSFVYTGTSSHKSESNILSSFGHMVNCTFMQNLASMTNGFCFYLDENLDICEIVARGFFYFFNLKFLDLQLTESKWGRKKNCSDDLNDLRQILAKDSVLGQVDEYELPKDLDLMQFVRIRAQEGFFLANLTRQFDESENALINVYLKKVFTQTVSVIYKIKSALSSKCILQLWIAWDSVQFKAKHQNVDSLRKLKQFLNQISASMQKYQFELTASMREAPEILSKYKEPLYKLSNESINDEHYQKNTFSLQNINFELNNRTIKNHEVDYYNEFAHSWSYLSFFKLHPKALSRYFAIHSIKMILHHDRPVPDINSCIFDLKTRSSLDSFNPNYIPNSVFQSTKAINELRSLLTTWCDIMLVENCIFLKFYHSSIHYLRPGEMLEDSQESENADDSKEKLSDTNNSVNSNNLASKNSFVICIVSDQYAPFVSLQFLFHSNVYFIDRMRILESFKDMLRSLNFKKDKEINSKDHSAKKLEQISVLQKTDLYDAFKFILFDEIQNNSDPKLNQSSKLVDFMLRKKFKWTLENNFSAQTAQNLKETLIDTFIRMRMKEGFRCLFQCSKFVAFTLQLTMLDSTESQNSRYKSGSAQTCTFIYVIRFHKNENSNLLNVAVPAQIEAIPNTEIYFVTEIYAEAIDGVYQERVRKKDRIDYFKNLTNNEILNMIYLQDYKCFSILQSSSALFLSKNNLYENLNGLISKSELTKPIKIEDSELKEMLDKILDFEDKFYDCIRLVPDLNVILCKHLLKELGKKSTLVNPVSQCLLNRVNYQTKSHGKKDTSNLLSGNLNSGSEGVPVKKKNVPISLYEQLRPVLSSIDVSRYTLNQEDFKFSLKGILIESSLFVCVYDDIPFNLFNSNSEDGFKKIQQYFFHNVDETFRKIDDSKDNTLFQSVVRKIKSDVKNSLMLKLNDIKTGDLITKRILEHLRQTENYDSFKIFIKFNLHQTTSKNCYSSPSNSNYNRASNTQKSNPWMSQSQIINPQFDIENNKLYIYGLFFINADASTEQCEPRVQDSNRLVFFLFNSVSESLKTSLIHTQSNSYLIRKSLFTTSNSSEHKFYISKNTIAKAASHQDLKSQQIQLRKLSDILKQNLSLNSQNDGSFLSMIDLIEENCAKTYVNSIVHFLASDVSDGVSIDKSTVQRLLRLGAKIKITDIDLTDYVRITCHHLKDHGIQEPCSVQQTSYLHQKFEQIFLKRFQTIAGFNDLFVIQSDYLKDVDMLPQAEYSNDDFSPSEETEENEPESEDLEANFFETDANELIKKKRRKKKIDSSSPYSNLTKNISSTESFFLTREQVIGIEVICQVSCDPDSDLVESRTRTTTLTAENNELDDSIGAPSIPAQCSHSFCTKFVKFDFNCVLKLIDNRELAAFKSLTSKLNLNEAKNSVKILLRFNWYSFNELNLNYPLNIFAPSSSAQANTAPNLSNHSSTNTQINFENFSYLEPCLNDLKWHLKDELLNNQTSIDSLKTFSQYVMHIKQGVEAGIVNCSKYSKKIVLSKVTTSKFNSSVEPGQLKGNKLNSALLQNRPHKMFTTTQTEEDKSLISVDPGKFFAELSSLLLSLNFYASRVQNLNPNFFFLDCSGQQVGFKIFLIVRRFDRREVTNGRNNKSSPSQSQEGASSPNSQLKTSLQKQSTSELQKLNLPKTSLVYKETSINQLKMSAYFSFNHSDLSVKQDQQACKKLIVDEFESQIKTLIRLCYLKITLKDINESHKWNNSLVLTEDKNLSFSDSLSNSLNCSCVWSVYFKLHRLHQTLQKVHETNNYISQGLSKLRDCLHNFKIYESACADLYVYTKNTNDVFLLKLDEVYDDEERRQSSMLSRRPSYASINDSEQTIVSSRNTSSQGLKSQNLSGGTHRIETQTSLTQAQAKLNPPEYVKLSVYGLEEPDDEMKKDLCKTLQSELDYCLLNRMSNSIEKNTYKTTSQQHPDKINDEDINFFKQASDSVLDHEVALPFLFNFNRTLREMFFFFVKQVFYANFKSIDPSQAKASNPDTQDQKYSNNQLSLFYIPESKHFAKKNSDTSLADAILISRIFFQNSKSKRIGKQNVSLILVEAFYSISGLDTSTNRVTRSNSMGASSIKFEHDSLDKKLRQSGPSFVFKFYSKGETAEIVNYKILLRKAVRDALTYFLSDYITRVDPVDYTKKMMLKKQPAKFRVLDSDFITSKLHRKRHKSTGATELSSNKQFLQMNKTARESRLGRVLVSQSITDTSQFNSFVITNFSLNTFDHKDHEDTLQYFKQPRRMLNMACEEYDSDESITSDSDEEINLYKVQRSISMEPELEKIHLDRLSNEKTYLKLIYDWLKGVHSSQTSSLGSFLLRKQFMYRTKYNLTSLIKDFEVFVKEMCKCDLGVNFFSFKRDGPKDSSRLNDSVFLDEDDFDVDEFANLKISKLSMVNSNLARGENVIVTINAEYSGLSGFSSMSSSMNSSSSNHGKFFSSGNSSSTLVQSSSNTTMSTVMVKSISSANGDSELPSNQTVPSQNLKRTFCFIIVNAKTKFVTFCCFTTESSNYDSLKQWLDQSAETITQRFHLVNNTVLYKFGGLIGDNIITDLKKVKQLAISSTCGFAEASSASQSDLFSSETKQHPQRTQLASIKLSKSPTIHRQSSTTKPLSSPINPALIANLQFNSTNFSLASGASTPSQSSATHQQTAFSLKQFYMTPIGVKSYDSIATNINQQVNFCVQNLGQQTPSSTDFSIISPSNAKFLSQSMKSQCLYGVGMCYQLLEMQQIYRHPRKIYELAIGSGSLQNISPNSQNSLKPQSTKPNTSNTNLVSPSNQLGCKFSLSDFYKNSIQPVFIPFHYCCTPLLFYSNWTESITNEKMLKSCNIKPTKTNTAITNNENWYFKMRQIVLVEYSKYFESKDFVRLRDDRQIQESRIGQNDSQMLHFIKWLQQDGFLYLTINLDEIYLHVRVGVCSRYRSSNRQSFISEIVRFLTQDFHVHSFIYDFHLSAINSNFLSSSQSGMQISQTSYIVSKFLDEFVEFFSRVPLYSQNKVFKLVYEKADNSLKQNQFTIIFDFISYANKKLGMGSISFQTLHTFGNNLTIYSLNDSSNSSKYLIVKLEQFAKEVLRNKLNSSQTMGKSSSMAGAEKSRMENFIRITCFYLFINKSSELGMFANQGVMNDLNNDLEFISKVIEESVSMHRQKVFWDNLALSMNGNKGELKNIIEISEVELEQILNISERVNVLELDPDLDEFLKQCYQIKEKIKDYFRLELSRNFIYTESDTIEYCLLIVTDSLISSFKSDQGQEQNGSESSLRSFVLLKFDKIKCATELFQVNRVKIVDLGGKQSDASNMIRENSLAGKEISQVINSLYGSKLFKSFGFVINILLCTLWNSLF